MRGFFRNASERSAERIRHVDEAPCNANAYVGKPPNLDDFLHALHAIARRSWLTVPFWNSNGNSKEDERNADPLFGGPSLHERSGLFL